MNRVTAAIDHRWAQPRLSAYLEADLTQRQHRRLERHAGICPECRNALKQLGTLLRALPGLRGTEPDADSVAERTVEAMRRRIHEEPDR